MRVFGFDIRRTEKTYSVRDLARDVGFGSPGIAPLDPWKVISEAFAGNATVYTATMKVASAAASVPWIPQARLPDGELDDLPATHELVKLVRRPGVGHSWSQVIEAMVASLRLFGEAYAYLNGPGLPETDKAPGRPPTELVWIPTHWVEPLYNDLTMEIRAYRVQTRDGYRDIPPHRMVAPHMWNPTSPWRGMGSVRPAALSIDTLNMGRKWNRTLLAKGARPSGAFVTKEPLPDATYQRLRLSIDRDISGPDNAGKIMLIDGGGGADWKSTTMTAADLEFQDGLRETKRDIAVAFGVDPSVIGDHQARTFNNHAEARLSLYQDTVLPILQLVRDTLEARLEAWWPDTCFYLDEDKVPALMEAKREAWGSLADLVEKGLITRNEARREMGYDDVVGGDQILVPLALVPLEEAGQAPPPGDQPPADAPPKAPAAPPKPGERPDPYAQG